MPDHIPGPTAAEPPAADISFRKNAPYLAAMDLVKEGLSSSETFEMAMHAVISFLDNIVTMKQAGVLAPSPEVVLPKIVSEHGLRHRGCRAPSFCFGGGRGDRPGDRRPGERHEV